MDTAPLSSSTNVGSPDQQQAGAPVLLASSSPAAPPAPAPPPPPPPTTAPSVAPQQQQPPHGNILHLWTDGSRLPNTNHAGAGIAHQDHATGQWFARAISLGELAHIQDAEAYGFYEALVRAEELLAQHQDLAAVIQYITVGSDCARVVEGYGAQRLFASKKAPVREWLVSQDIEQKVAAFERRGITVTADKVKGHSGVQGNEIADRAAGFGAKKARDHGDVEEVRYFDNPPIKM